MIFIGLLAFAAVTFAYVQPGYVHGGGLDSDGCHHDRRRGGYHCHRSSSSGSFRPRSKRMGITTLPKAQVWVDGKYKGVSPIKNIKFSASASKAKLMLRHPVLGSHTETIDVRDDINLQIRW